MRDPKRIVPLLAMLGEYWIDNPDLRLGQIIVNMSLQDGKAMTFHMEDDVLLERLKAGVIGEGECGRGGNAS